MSAEPPSPTPVALPSRDDSLVAALSEPVGGPAGAHAVPVWRWWGPVRVALATVCVVLALGLVVDGSCHTGGWAERDRATWTNLCYSDIPFLYRERGFADGSLAYRDTMLEYPVLTGLVMQGSAYVTKALVQVGDDGDRIRSESQRFFEVSALLLGIAAVLTVFATARTVVRRPWDGLLVAASPVLLLSGTINWDLLAVALSSLAILAWTRERPGWAGVLIGLGVAAKLYPILLLGPLLLVSLRGPARRAALARFVACAGSALGAWLLVNIPVYLWAPGGWRAFYSLNRARPAEFGSPWYAIELVWPGRLPDDLNVLVTGMAVVLLVLIVALAFTAPEPPRLAQLAFLAVAAFLLVNKVWSPQYALWLLPLAVLARPRWRDLLIWQAAEVVYFVAVWWHLASLTDPEDPLISSEFYAGTVALRVVGLLWLVTLVVRDILRPWNDGVRPYLDPSAPARMS